MSNIVGDEIHNTEPASGKPMPPVKVSTAAEVREAVVRARRAQESWRALGFGERKRTLLRFRDLIDQHLDELVGLLTRQNGKPKFEALQEVFSVIDFAHYYSTRAKKILRPRKIWLHLLWFFHRSRIEFVPRGVVGIIAPWNFPLWIPIGDVLMALAAGNAVVLKPSEWAPHTALRARELMIEAGLDPDLFAVLPGAGETGQALVDSNPDMMIFTGSVATGRKVAAACGERLIPFIAELGGKDPVIVLPDADVDLVAKQVVNGSFYNCGQACASMERVLVHESLYEPFVDRVLHHTRKLRIGDPTAIAGHTDIGPLVVPSQVDIVRKHVEDAVAGGARVLAGGHAAPAADLGRFYEPTVLVDVTEDMLCWKEETFGPTLPIRRFSDVDEAVKIANDSAYGLNAYVFSGSIPRGTDVALRLEAGSVVVNDWLVNAGAPETPWGGVKTSGMGRVHGRQGLRDMCEIRHVFVPRGYHRIRLPMLYPYTEWAYRVFHRGLRRLFRGLVARFV